MLKLETANYFIAINTADDCVTAKFELCNIKYNLLDFFKSPSFRSFTCSDRNNVVKKN